MSLNSRLLRKSRKVMGVAVASLSCFCSLQICYAEVFCCFIDGVNYKYNSKTKCLTISGQGKVPRSSIYLRPLVKAKFPIAKFSYQNDPDLIGKAIKHVVIEDGITEICELAFEGLFSLEDIVIPNSVTKIGERAFKVCYSLKKITIPESVTEIQQHTFNFCRGLEEIKLPESVKDLGGSSFDGCGIEEIIIPSHVEGIETGLFYDCKSLKSIKIPSSIKYIHYSAFRNCEKLSKVEFYAPPINLNGDATDYLKKCPEKYRYFGCICRAMEKKAGARVDRLHKNLAEFLISGPVIYPFSFQGCKTLQKISFPLNTMFNLGEDDMSPVSTQDIILRSGKLKRPCGCCTARCTKLSDFFEPNMEVEINGKTYCVK